MSSPLVACLTVTNRPEWGAFCRHQVEKQTHSPKKHIIVSGAGNIASLRNVALERARDAGAKYVAWFDDDDWSHPERLYWSVANLELGHGVAVGNVRAWFISSVTRRGTLYQAPEGIVFNGAVFSLRSVPARFDESRQVGEDTDWLDRWQQTAPAYSIVGLPLHAWLCHRRNVTNRIDTRTFEEHPPQLLSKEDWRLVP